MATLKDWRIKHTALHELQHCTKILHRGVRRYREQLKMVLLGYFMIQPGLFHSGVYIHIRDKEGCPIPETFKVRLDWALSNL